ncbi:uncharacterized protein LOC144411736 [Styela clava]
MPMSLLVKQRCQCKCFRRGVQFQLLPVVVKNNKRFRPRTLIWKYFLNLWSMRNRLKTKIPLARRKPEIKSLMKDIGISNRYITSTTNNTAPVNTDSHRILR